MPLGAGTFVIVIAFMHAVHRHCMSIGGERHPTNNIFPIWWTPLATYYMSAECEIVSTQYNRWTLHMCKWDATYYLACFATVKSRSIPNRPRRWFAFRRIRRLDVRRDMSAQSTGFFNRHQIVSHTQVEGVRFIDSSNIYPINWQCASGRAVLQRRVIHYSALFSIFKGERRTDSFIH